MGTESESKYKVYLDGVPIDPEKIVNFTVTAEETEPDGLLAGQSLEITMHFKAPKCWRCRSRKRFIKLVMSEGISRNRAEWMADFARALMPYREAWRNVLWGIWTFENRVD